MQKIAGRRKSAFAAVGPRPRIGFAPEEGVSDDDEFGQLNRALFRERTEQTQSKQAPSAFSLPSFDSHVVVPDEQRTQESSQQRRFASTPIRVLKEAERR
ncbi:unnamed protein product [Caenorhabditis auriculariae]|uniref:Uncharacterized protein n=1 Tax=Caenorhabditis auriculariae TaxID=2777116 RepID=A0A8S1H7M9_9PELO|nr:unnamed protein product [Caenorhabditis auriculariae]